MPYRNPCRLLGPVLIPLLSACLSACFAPSADLHQAAAKGDLDEIAELLRQKIPVDQRNQSGHTALWLAAYHGRSKALKLLLEAGADIEAKAPLNMRPLHAAALTGQVEATRLLIDSGARVNAGNLAGLTPLHLSRDAKLSGVLLDAGADIHARDLRRMTPLHFAVAKDLAKLLIDRGAQVTALDATGHSPADMTAVTNCTQEPLRIYPRSITLRMRDRDASLEVLVLGTLAQQNLKFRVRAEGADLSIEPSKISQIRPGQLLALQIQAHRRSDRSPGRSPLIVEIDSTGAPGRCQLWLDTRQHETPADRGMLPAGELAIRAQTPRWRQALTALLPVLVLALATLLWWWRRAH